MTLRILIADDSELIRKGIKDLLTHDSDEWQVCGEAADGDKAVKQAMELKPDVILLDLSISHLSGFRVVESLQHCLPTATIVMISQQEPSLLKHIAGSLALQCWIPKSKLAEEMITTLGRSARDKHRSVRGSLIPSRSYQAFRVATRFEPLTYCTLGSIGQLAARPPGAWKTICRTKPMREVFPQI